MTQQEFENEPVDIYNLNLAIMSKINAIHNEEIAHREAAEDRESRMSS